MVGARGFEPPASSSRTMRAARLRYAPINEDDYSITLVAVKGRFSSEGLQ